MQESITNKDEIFRKALWYNPWSLNRQQTFDTSVKLKTRPWLQTSGLKLKLPKREVDQIRGEMSSPKTKLHILTPHEQPTKTFFGNTSIDLHGEFSNTLKYLKAHKWLLYEYKSLPTMS